MSSYANSQSLNRYSYVLNNPLRYTDPTGHKETECTSQNDPLCSGANGGSTGNANGGGGSGNGKNKDKHGNDQGGDILGSGDNSIQRSYCAQNSLTCWSNFAQDTATTVDFLFAGLEVYLVTAGCIAGPEGCGGGLLISWTIFNMGPNQIESALSGISLILTAVEDYSEDQQFGDNTSNSLATFLVGGINPDPIADLAIDGYASGYNHGFFNSLTSILNGMPFMKNPAVYK